MTLIKYPRTQHIKGSRFQHGDHDLEAVDWHELRGKNLVVEEKMDGSNVGVSFLENGQMMLQSRGHYLRGGPREKHFAQFKQWASAKQEELFCVLGSRYVMYGEWLHAKHTMYYDAFPHFFMEFDVLDTKDNSNVFLSTGERNSLFSVISNVIFPVKVLAEGKFDELDDLEKLVVKSHFVSVDNNERMNNLKNAARSAGTDPADVQKHTDPSNLMEGLYVKWEEDGLVKGRYKFVRESFTSSILDQETHWQDRPLVFNKLKVGGYENMYE